MYRKFLEPKYGEVAPWVRREQYQPADFQDLAAWRRKSNATAFAYFTSLFSSCYCFDRLMSVSTEETSFISFDDQEIGLRIYRLNRDSLRPLLIFYHGGGWMLNDLDVYDYFCRQLAASGAITVVSVDYRLAPEHRFPAGLEDAYYALLWAADHVEELNISDLNISVCGDSSGGNFAAAVALLSRDRNGPKISSQILIYPVTSVAGRIIFDSAVRYGGGDCFLPLDPAGLSLGDFYLCDARDRLNPYVSMLEAKDLRNLPPACFILAECDPLLDQGLMYAARLEDDGIPVDVHLYEGMLHGFINHPYPPTFDAVEKIIRFVV